MMSAFPRPSRAFPGAPDRVVPYLAVASMLVLPLLYALQMETFATFRAAEVLGIPWNAHPIELRMLAIALGEIAALAVLYRALDARFRLPAGAPAIGVIAWLAMVALSLVFHSDGDVAAYVGYATLPHFGDAYQPRTVPFTGSFASLNAFLGVPMTPAVYGPFWLLYDRLLVHWVPTLGTGVFVLKLFGAVTAGALVVALQKLGVPRGFLAIVALNPALIADAVYGGHNDFVPATLCVAAILAMRSRRIAIAVACAVAAILVKITFVVLALVVFAGAGRRRERVIALVATLAGATAGVALFGGAPYLHAMAQVGARATHDPGRVVYLHALAAAIAVVLAALALWRNRWYPSLSWTFAMLSSATYAWYLAWGLPYAARRPEGWSAASLLLMWPLLQLILHEKGPVTAFVGILVLLVWGIVSALRTRNPLIEDGRLQPAAG